MPAKRVGWGGLLHNTIGWVDWIGLDSFAFLGLSSWEFFSACEFFFTSIYYSQLHDKELCLLPACLSIFYEKSSFIGSNLPASGHLKWKVNTSSQNEGKFSEWNPDSECWPKPGIPNLVKCYFCPLWKQLHIVDLNLDECCNDLTMIPLLTAIQTPTLIVVMRKKKDFLSLCHF